MRIEILRATAIAAAYVFFLVAPSRGQHAGHAEADSGASAALHQMWSAPLGGWQIVAMGQLFPAVTGGNPFGSGALRRTGWYSTQPAVMANLLSPGRRLVLRATLNFEGITQPDGELTYGAWGEGFIDKRHPHTLFHELVLSYNDWDVLGGQASLSLGKAFAPFGTDDPMSRPPLKYPTNHHLSQILERWTAQGAFEREGWSVEAGLFGGDEPDGPYDFSNITPFGNSVSARLAHRWGAATVMGADMAASSTHGAAHSEMRSAGVRPWEASVSIGSVLQATESGDERTYLWNAAIRHESVKWYGLLEASLADPQHESPYVSLLGEGQLVHGRHRPYARLELATRPEYDRLGAPGTVDFFRYDHDADPIGATRWVIGTAGYGYEATTYPLSVRPFAEIQFFGVGAERGEIDPEALFGGTRFWGVSLGARLFIGGDPMRMGMYGVLDAMNAH